MKLRFNGLESKTVSLVQRFHIHRALNCPRGMEMDLSFSGRGQSYIVSKNFGFSNRPSREWGVPCVLHRFKDRRCWGSRDPND